MAFSSVHEMIDLCKESGKPLYEVILESDLAESGLTRAESEAEMHRLWAVMQATSDGYCGADRSMSGFVGGDAAKVEQAAAREGSFAWEWLEGQTLLLQNQTQRQGQYILQELRSRRLHPAEILESSNIRAAAALAANGYGIGFLSGELLEHLNNAVPFNAFPLRDCTLPLESVAAWRAGNYLPRYALAFIERMEQLENQKYNNSALKAL